MASQRLLTLYRLILVPATEFDWTPVQIRSMSKTHDMNLLDLDDKIILRVVSYLESPREACKLALSHPNLMNRFRTPIVCRALLQRFFHTEITTKNTIEVLGQPLDISLEFWTMAKYLWPHLSSSSLTISCTNSEQVKNSISTSRIRIEPNEIVQVQEPLAPLPLGRGRIRYIEFSIKTISAISNNPKIAVGLALPGVEGEWLGKTVGSAAIDLFATGAYCGNSIVHSLSPTVNFKPGDCIGIGMCYESHNDERQLDCFFATHNGDVLFEHRTLPATYRGFYMSSVYACEASLELTVNRGDTPFIFDIAAFQSTHADHDFFRTYLSVVPQLFNQDGQVEFWTDSTLAALFAYHSHYRPAKLAFSKLNIAKYCEQVSALQLKLINWKYAYGEMLELLESAGDGLPAQLSDLRTLHTFLTNHDIPVYDVSFDLPILEVQRLLVCGLTRFRYHLHMDIIRLTMQRLIQRPSLFEDVDEIRGGTTEGWMKQAIFLADALNQPSNPWTTHICDSILDALTTEEWDLAMSCPGYFEIEMDRQTQREAEEGVNDISHLTESDNAAIYLLAVATAHRAWASWAPLFVENLRRFLVASRPGIPRPLPCIPTERDPTLTLYALTIYSRCAEPLSTSEEVAIAPSYAWVLMMFLSMGYSSNSPINVIPSNYIEAYQALKQYFAQEWEKMDHTQVVTDLKQLYDSPDKIPFSLEYLAYHAKLTLDEEISAAADLYSQLMEYLLNHPTDQLNLDATHADELDNLKKSFLSSKLAESSKKEGNHPPPPTPSQTSETPQRTRHADSDMKTAAPNTSLNVPLVLALVVASSVVTSLVTAWIIKRR